MNPEPQSRFRMSRGWLATAILPVFLAGMLIASAIRTYRQLDGQREIFLRGRAAAVAARLETMVSPQREWEDRLAEEEPALAHLMILDRGAGGSDLAGLWEGRELYRTERIEARGEGFFRAYVPFHSEAGLRLARIDIDESAADFLVEHASHHVWLVVAGSVAIVLLFAFAVWGARRAAQSERRQLEQRHLAHLGGMAAVLAHEIRNPLGSIKGYAQLLLERLDADGAALAAPIVAEALRLEALAKELLLYGRPVQPRLRTVESAEIAALVQRAAEGVEVSMSPFTLQTDPDLLEQILLNLLRNAQEAVPVTNGACIRFGAHIDGKQVVLAISDNGVGLSDAVRQRLFEPFFTTKASGTGLGLSICRKLAAELGGRLEVSNQPGGGARAELRLPRKPFEG